MKKFILIAMLVLLPTQAQAKVAFIDGNNLVKQMRENDNSVVRSPNTDYSEVRAFQGFTAGVFDTLSALDMICPSTSITGGQVSAIVTKYLKDNPEKWNEAAINLVHSALMNAFPCKK